MGKHFNRLHLLFIPLVILIYLEYLYFSKTGSLGSEFSSLSELFTITVILGIWNYYLFASKNPYYGPLGRVPLGSYLDVELTSRYNSNYSAVAGRRFEIYFYMHQTVARNRSPIFTVYGHVPRIYANEMFFKASPERDEDAMILHEIGHIRHGDPLKVSALSLSFLISAGGIIISLLATLNYGLSSFNLWFIAISAASSAACLVSLKMQLVIQESRADRFAARTMGETAPMINALNRSYAFVEAHGASRHLARMKNTRDSREKLLKRMNM